MLDYCDWSKVLNSHMGHPGQFIQMHPSKILTLLALGISSFSPLAQASNGGDKQKKDEPSLARRKIRKTTDTKSAVIPDLIIRDSSNPTQHGTNEKSLTGSEKISQLELEREGAEAREKGSKNFMSIIMNRYRRDMKIAPVLENSLHRAPVDEVLKFLECFEDCPREYLTDSSKFDEIMEAYSFFQYIGKIPLNPNFPDICQEIKTKAELNSFEDILKVYREKKSIFTVINWDLLNLTPFKTQYFPVTESMIKPFEFTYEVYGKSKTRTHTTPPSLTVYGKKVLQKYVDKVRFLNPKTLKGRSILLYQRIYRRYLKDLGSNANDYYIDWEHCRVNQWPANMDRSRVLKWTDSDIKEMNALIDSNSLKFRVSSEKIANAPFPLGKSKKVDLDYYTDIKGTIGDKDKAISDDEDFGGKEREALFERIKATRLANEKKQELVKKKSKITRRVFEEDHETSEDDERPMQRKKSEPTQRLIKKTSKFDSEDEEAEFGDESDVHKKRKIEPSKLLIKKKPKFESSDEEADFSDKKKKASNAKPKAKADEEAEFDDEYIQKQMVGRSVQKKSSSSKQPAKKFVTKESEDGVKIFNIKVDSSKPASPEARQTILDELLEMFRRQTGQSDATEIDWSLAKIHHLQNHLLPFSTKFETTGDIQTLRNLLRSRSFKFLNLSKFPDRRIRVYERLYAIYAKTTGKYRNEYDIEWDDIEFFGIPDEIDENFLCWGKGTVAEIEAQLDRNAITCEMTEDMKEEIAEVEAKMMAKEGSSELSESPVSATSNVNSAKSSDIEIRRTDESSPASLLVEDAPIEGERLRMGILKQVQNTVNTSEEVQYKTPCFMTWLWVKSPSGSKNKPKPPLLAFTDNDDELEDSEIAENAKNDSEKVLVKDMIDEKEETKRPAEVAEKASAKSDYVPIGRWFTVSKVEHTETADFDENRVIAVGDFAGNTVGQVLAHQNSIQESISNYTQARESFGEYSRHRRLMNYVIQCLELILDNVQNSESPEPRRMGINEIHVYLNIFLDALAGLGSSDDIESLTEWKKLVIAIVRFRARLAGAKAKYSRHKYFVVITESIIHTNYRDLIGFLTGPENKWDLDLLDQLIDSVEIFKNN